MRHASPHPSTKPTGRTAESSTDLPGFEFLVNRKEVLSSQRPILPGTRGPSGLLEKLSLLRTEVSR